jgi:hypothetical protein
MGDGGLGDSSNSHEDTKTRRHQKAAKSSCLRGKLPTEVLYERYWNSEITPATRHSSLLALLASIARRISSPSAHSACAASSSSSRRGTAIGWPCLSTDTMLKKTRQITKPSVHVQDCVIAGSVTLCSAFAPQVNHLTYLFANSPLCLCLVIFER